jgi:hypothetical protein
MQKAAPIETSESDADTTEDRQPIRGMSPLTHSPMHLDPTAEPEQPALPRRSALVIEIMAFMLIAFLVGSALMFNLTASRPVAVSLPLPPKPEPMAAEVSVPAPAPEPAMPETAAMPPQETETTTAATLPEVQPQAGSTVTAQTETESIKEEPPPELSALPPADAPVANDNAAVASEPTPQAPPAAEETASLPLPPEDVGALIQRGDALLATGDIVAARAAYERAAAGGNRSAAMGVAKTYDPNFLAQAGVRGLRGDPARAALWYAKAAAAGDRDAQQRLRRLRAQYPQ